MLSAPVIHQRTPEPEGRASDFIALLETARPKQWIKNGFVLAAFLFAGAFTSWHGWRVSLSAFASFCLISSAIYMINDLADLEQDKIHPTKRLRPLPSGACPPRGRSPVHARSRSSAWELPSRSTWHYSPWSLGTAR